MVKKSKNNPFKGIAETQLEKDVADRFDDDDDPIRSAKEILEAGCQSGSCPGLVYYKDTLSFFEKNKSGINILLKEDIQNYGKDGSVESMFGKKWDKEDPLVMDTPNQNLLAWYGFEETTRKLLRKLGKED